MDDSMSAATRKSSLMIGLGAGSPGQPLLRNHLLRAILITMEQPQLADVLSAVTDIFTESTSYSRNAHAMRHQECFALKPKTDGMMDVIRKAFLANVDDIYRLADEYAEKYGINVTVKENVARGYYLSIPAELASELPTAFIQPVRSGRAIHCTTEEVHSLNSRAQDNVQDLLLMTHHRIQEVLDVARSHYDVLASLSDAIALLDMCHCFADNVASSRLPWCRPVVRAGQESSSGGELRIKNGRYGIDVSGSGASASRAEPLPTDGDFIPNDTFASQSKHFTVITGINGSGKSTYLRQLAIIVVLAQCGSYVPAEQAEIPVRDRLCTRIGTADDQEHNISTFMLEMKEAAFICNNATPRSLILIDELGRATSNEDGVAIAWSVAEHLISQQALTFFVTHYPQLTKLGDAYPAVQNQHMGAGTGGGELTYTHKILPGPCTIASDYGVDMAFSCGWPEDVIRNVRLDSWCLFSHLPSYQLTL
jgi:DNA mismatch repair protein MSH4